MITNSKSIRAFFAASAPSSLTIKLTEAKFATLRLSKDGKSIRDGRTYKTEKLMRANRSSRPVGAQMFEVKYLRYGFFELSEIA